MARRAILDGPALLRTLRLARCVIASPKVEPFSAQCTALGRRILPRVSSTAFTIPAMTHGSIPIFKARLPSADRLLPYLREIDASHYYSNAGPQCRAFEHRLAQR